MKKKELSEKMIQMLEKQRGTLKGRHVTENDKEKALNDVLKERGWDLDAQFGVMKGKKGKTQITEKDKAEALKALAEKDGLEL